MSKEISLASRERWHGRDSVLVCGSPLTLFLAPLRWESARRPAGRTGNPACEVGQTSCLPAEVGSLRERQIYRLTRKVAPFSSGFATFRATLSFSQQADFPEQEVLALETVLALSAQLDLSAQVAFAVEVALFEVFFSPA